MQSLSLEAQAKIKIVELENTRNRGAKFMYLSEEVQPGLTEKVYEMFPDRVFSIFNHPLEYETPGFALLLLSVQCPEITKKMYLRHPDAEVFQLELVKSKMQNLLGHDFQSDTVEQATADPLDESLSGTDGDEEKVVDEYVDKLVKNHENEIRQHIAQYKIYIDEDESDFETLVVDTNNDDIFDNVVNSMLPEAEQLSRDTKAQIGYEATKRILKNDLFKDAVDSGEVSAKEVLAYELVGLFQKKLDMSIVQVEDEEPESKHVAQLK